MANEIKKGGGLAFLRIFLFTIFFSFFAIFNVLVESSKNRRACFGAYFLFFSILLVHAEHSEDPVLIRVRDPSVKIDKKSKEKSRGQKRIIMSQRNP